MGKLIIGKRCDQDLALAQPYILTGLSEFYRSAEKPDTPAGQKNAGYAQTDQGIAETVGIESTTGTRKWNRH
jgi:hypothetical protein